LFTILLFIGSSLAAQITPEQEVVHAYKRVTVPDLAFITATDSNAAKAAVAIVLSSLKVKCDPSSQVESVTEANAESSLSTLSSKIAGTSCSMGGRMLRVNASFTPNAAIKANDLVASLKQNTPLLMRWQGAVYVLYGVVYDEHLFNSGKQDNVIREFLLVDPRYSDKRRLVAFERWKDDFAIVEGVMSLSLSSAY
jgi:hypothetical protein